jgi:uncharacterized membrane protein YfcA
VVGFGIGSLLTPLLAARYDTQTAVGIVALPHLLATALRFVQSRAFIDRDVLLRFGLPSAVGGLVGAVLQGRFSSPGLLLVLGVLLLATGIANLTRGFGGWRPDGHAAPALGLLSGFFGGLAGNQGGLRAAGLSGFPLEPRAFLATSTAVALLVDAARTPVYLARAGHVLLQLAGPITVAAAGCLLGTVLGERVLIGTTPDRYRRLVGAGVALVGLWLVLGARG